MPTASERIELITPLGEELLFHGMMAHEELSRLGEFQLDLLSKNKDVDRDKILGAKVTIKMMLHDDEVRYFNGFVTRFSAGAALGRYARYYATVSPWLWFLTRTADCRIFQDKTVRQIVEEVFADHPEVADFVFELTESYRTWKYCVQYRETDFNFVSRLLEHEGMYYYFRQTDGHHTLVVTDSVDKHNQTPGYETLQFIAPQVLVKPGTEYINAWEISREVQPGVYVHEDYDFERPSVDLTTTRTLPREYTPSNYEVYDYPGFYLQKPDGEQYAHVRIGEYGAKFEKAQATTNYRGVQVGARFTLEGHGVEKVNGEYLVVAATQTLESSQYESGDAAGTGSGFRCTFTALSCRQQFRPPRMTPKPLVHGPQTAIVVGPAGDEIYKDDYGRVKVQFHWDRYGKRDENSSCWIRVAQMWAGKGWGSVSTPRIGHEVIVDFLEGDPDQPIILGSVHNAENPPPHGGVVSGLKSNTHKGKGSNEMTMDDTAGKEKITIHGQYDMGTTVEHDQTNTVNNDFTETIKKNAAITITEGTYSHDVKAGTASYHVMGAVTQKFENIWDSKVTDKVSIKSNADITIDSDSKITLVTGSSKLVMESSGAIALTGTKITVIGNDQVGVSSAKTDVSGTSEAKFGTGNQSVATSPSQVVISGAAINSSAKGVHEITGAVVKIN